MQETGPAIAKGTNTQNGLYGEHHLEINLEVKLLTQAPCTVAAPWKENSLPALAHYTTVYIAKNDTRHVSHILTLRAHVQLFVHSEP